MNQSQHFFYGLDIQPEYLTIAQYSPDEHAVMLVAIQPLTGGGRGAFSEAVSHELGVLKSKFKFTKPGITCSLPGEYAIIKKAPVDRGERDIESSLRWELGQHVIGAVDDYVFDFQQLGTGADGLDEYLVVAYRQETVDELKQLLKRHKLAADVIDLDIFALVNVFEANYPEYIEQPVLLVHAESEQTTLLLTHHGKYIDHECIQLSLGVDPQAFSEQLKGTADRLASFATLSNGLVGVPVFATGSLFSQDGFLSTAGSYLGDVSLLQPFRKIGCRIGADEEQLAAYISQLAVAVGLAIRGNE